MKNWCYDWFTKVRSDVTYGHESDGKTGLLINEIALSFGSKAFMMLQTG